MALLKPAPIRYNSAEKWLPDSLHAFEANQIDSTIKNLSFNITPIETANEYAANPKFISVLETGWLVYVDNHFVINDPM